MQNLQSCFFKNWEKRKRSMEVVDSIVIRGQQYFDKYNQPNPVEIKINDDCMTNILNKKYTLLINFSIKII